MRIMVRAGLAVLSVGMLGGMQLARAQRPWSNVTPHSDVSPVTSQGERAESAAVPAPMPVVTVTLDAAPRLDALRTVAKAAGYDLMYSKSVIKLSGTVTKRFTKTPLSAAVEQLLRGTNVSAEISPATKSVRLTPRDTTEPQSTTPRQRGAIRGHVVDSATHLPVASAAIAIRGTSARALSAESGEYLIAGGSGNVTLVVRRLGYRSQSIPVSIPAGDTVTVNVALIGAPSVLSEVVTTGSGEREKVTVGNSIATINADSVVQHTAITNLSDLLDGRVQGLEVTRSSGTVGSASRLRVRGINSINTSNDPIVIVDGVRVATNYTSTRDGNIQGGNATPSRFDDIDPNIIESIEVLKGPSAAALWGSDAANGVIVIKTKRGQAGTTRLALRGEQGWTSQRDDFQVSKVGLGTLPNGPTVVRCTVMDQANGICAHIDSVQGGFNRFANSRTTPIGTGLNTTIGADLSGGSSTVQYFLSGTRTNQLDAAKLPEVDQRVISERLGSAVPGWMKRPTAQKKDNLDARLTGQPVEQLDYSVTGSLVSLTQRNGPNGISNNSLTSAMTPEDTLDITPGWELAGKQRSEHVSRFTTAGNATWRPTSFFSASGTIGRDYAYRTDRELMRRGWCFTCTTNDTLGSIVEGTGITTVSSANLNGTLNFPVNDTWTFRTAFGGQFQRTKTSDIQNSGKDLPDGRTDLNSAQSSKTFSQTSDDRATVGTFIEQSVAWNDRLFLSAAVRRDLGSALGKDVAPLFPKWSLSWVISDEPFFPWRDQGVTLRLRTAFGHAGIQPGSLDRFRSYSQAPRFVSDAGLPGLNYIDIDEVGNAALRPERSTEWEGGFELGLADERVTMDFTWFRKFARDAIVYRQLAPSLGIGGSQAYNVGNVANAGIEGTLTARLIENDLMRASILLGVSARRNKLVTLGPNVEPYAIGSDTWDVNSSVVRAGYPLFGRWAVPIAGYKDINGDGLIAATEIKYGDSLVFMGPQEPKLDLTIGPSLGFWHDRVTLTAQLAYRQGLTQLNEGRVRAINSNPALYDPATPIATQACYVAASTRSNKYCFYETVDFLRWNSLSLSYVLPERLIRPLRANSVTLSLLGQDLGVWTNYRGIDPGLNTADPSGNLNTNNNPVPLPRHWTLRARVTF